MTNLKTTKRALLSSVVALLVCFTMLLGTTFAWFTDSVTSNGNIIQTGTLDVSLEHADTVLGVDDEGWVDASTGAIFNYDNWEPGYTQVKYVKIENEGTLDLKFILNIIPNNEAEEVNLADVIEVYMVDGAVAVDRDALTTDSAAYVGTLTSLMNETDGAAHGVLYADDADKAGNVYEIYTIALKMSTSAGNEYMGKNVGGGFAVQLLATQLASESDSFGSDYDVNAPYTLPAGVTTENFGDNVAYYNGTYYASLADALMAIHAADVEESVVYLKPNADLGYVNHAHVCSSITIYGNNAYITSGEADFEIGIPQTVTCTIDSEINLTVYDLDGCAVWGSVPENATVNISLNNCDNVHKIVLPNYSTGNYDLSVTVNGCSFTATESYNDSAIWCRGLDSLTVKNTTFKDYAVGINQNNKDTNEAYTIENCTFIDCATSANVTTQTSYAAPIRAVASKSGAVTTLVINNCEFVYSNLDSVAINGNIVTYQDGDAGTVNATVDGTAQ